MGKFEIKDTFYLNDKPFNRNTVDFHSANMIKSKYEIGCKK